VVQEYERAVIFRLGRLLEGGSKGPGKIEKTIIIPDDMVSGKMHVSKMQLLH
jgi:hypothetical protein